MKRLFRSSGMALMLAGTIISGGCETDMENKVGPETSVENKNTTVLVHLESTDNYQLMTEAIRMAGFEDLLNNPAVNYTILAPHDLAMREYLSSKGYGNLDELQSKLGERGFRNFVAYHLLEGKYDVRSFPRGFVNVYAQNNSELQLDLLVSDDVRTGIGFNGTNENSAIKTSSKTVSAVNGNVMEIDKVLSAQDNLENFTEGFKEDYEFYHMIHKGAGSYYRELLSYKNGMVLVGNNEMVEGLIQLNFRELITANILKTMLDERRLEKLMRLYSVNNLEDLAAVVEYHDLKNANFVSVEDLMANLSTSGYRILTDYAFLNADAENGNIYDSKRAYNRAGVSFEVGIDNGYLILTDRKENQLYLETEPVSGANGAIYRLVKINIGK